MQSGQKLTPGRFSGERIETSTETADSSTFTTTETSIGSVTASLVTGRTYRVRLFTRIGTTVANDVAIVRVREDSVAGAELVGDATAALTTSVTGNTVIQEIEYTATATGAKTFVATCVRSTGSGSLRREASSTRPTYLYVDYIRG